MEGLQAPIWRHIQFALAAGAIVLLGSVVTVSTAAEAASASCTIVGTDGDDTLNGTPGDDVICGLGGNDRIRGGDGDDRILAGGGRDRVWGDGGNDTIDGGPGADVLSGGGGDDIITDPSGRNKVNGQGGNDVLSGGGVDDIIDGGGGADIIYGYGGDDRLLGGPGGDQIFGGAGNDVLEGGTGNDVLRGGVGPDGIGGGDGVDRANGGPGTDLCDAELEIDCESASDLILYEDEWLRIVYRSRGETDTAFVAEIDIENLDDSAVAGWTLLLGLDHEVTEVEGGSLLSQGGGNVAIVSESMNRVIPPGQGATVKISANKAADGSIAAPYFAVLLKDGDLPETDGDGDSVPDFIERRAGWNPESSDTDGDGLTDDIEWLTGTSPLEPDSDGDGTGDGQEDLDGDGLGNLDEINDGTSLDNPDTDDDRLDDGDERSRGTDPLDRDTDGDGVGDGEEVEIGSNPLVGESTFEVTRSLRGELVSPTVSLDGLSSDQVESFQIARLPVDQPEFPKDTPGYVDQGYELQIDGEFGEAEVSFAVDPSLIGDGFEPAIYTYDEAEQRLIEVPGQSISGGTISASVTHFSKYILLNRIEFEFVWLYEFLEVPDDGQVYDRLDVVFSIDSSGSMTTNDPGNLRVQVAKDFVRQLGADDRAAVVDFDLSSIVRSPLTSDKNALISALDQIDSSGGTSLTAGVSTSLSQFDPPVATTLRTVILLTDGIGAYDPALTGQAAADGIVIHTVGLGAGVDSALLTRIATETGGRYFPAADADELVSIFEEIRDVSDLLRDSDDDGINDYYEKEMRAGNLLLGNGVPVGLMDPFDADSDDDGIDDGDELLVLRVPLSDEESRVYAFLTSDPLLVDSDGDGVADPDDPRPLVYDPTDLLIHQSAHREGRRKEPDLNNFQVPPSQIVADDLTFNDYTSSELRGLGPIFWVAPVTPEFMMWGEFNDIFLAGKLGADSDHRAVIDGLTDDFRNGRDGVGAGSVTTADLFDPGLYSQPATEALNRAVGGSPQMQEYIELATDLIVTSIEENNGGIDHLRIQDDLNENYLYQLFDRRGLRYPVYDLTIGANERALSIAIHQFHGHQIFLEDYRIDGDQFSGTLVFHSYDHFGLDVDDEITEYGFVDWFTLQHYDRFDGKYVPSLAVVDIRAPLSGSL